MTTSFGAVPCHEIEVKCNGQVIRPCCKDGDENHGPVAGARAASVLYEDRAGTAIVEGDIQIGSTQDFRFRSLASELPGIGRVAVQGLVKVYGAIVASKKRAWPGGRIPYEFSTSINWKDSVKKHFEGMIKLWNDKYGSVITLSPRNTADFINYVIISLAKVSDSHVGRKLDGSQTLNLRPGVPQSEFLHEICHVAGLYHEHSRNDRDKYIEVKWCNIYAKQRRHFCPYFSNGREHQQYDFHSIMHYPPNNAFGPAATFSVTAFGKKYNGGKTPEFEANELSPGDVAALKALYS